MRLGTVAVGRLDRAHDPANQPDRRLAHGNGGPPERRQVIKAARVAGMQKLAAPWGATAPERRLGGGTRRIIQQSGRQEGRWDGDTPPAYPRLTNIFHHSISFTI